MRNNLLITGGSGFIGTNVINFFNNKFNIYNIDKISYCSTLEKFKTIDKKKYFFHKFNLKNKKKLKNFLKKSKIDTVIHFAAESHVDRSIESPYQFIEENILSTTSLYDSIYQLTKKKLIKNPNIIHISTDEVFGSLKKGSATENSLFCPNSPYAASKASTEYVAKSFATTFGLRICIIRLCNNYGPYQFTEKFIPTCILNINKNNNVPIYGRGINIREWMHVNDTCEAIELIIRNFKKNENYNIGSGFKVTNFKILKTISKIMKKKINYQFVKDRPSHDMRYSLNSKKFAKDYKWKPKFNLLSGLKDTVEWYLQNKSWLEETFKRYKGQRLGDV